MEPTEQGFIDSYNPQVTDSYNKSKRKQVFQVNPTITNTFSTAAMRFGHSLIAGVIKSFNIFGSEVGYVLHTEFTNSPFLADQVCAIDQEPVCTLRPLRQPHPWIFCSWSCHPESTGASNLMLSSITNWSWNQAMDADMSAELTDHLFQQDDEKFGLDLVQYNHWMNSSKV